MISIFGGGSFAVDSLFLFLPLSMGVLCLHYFCPSSFSLILMGNRELVALIVIPAFFFRKKGYINFVSKSVCPSVRPSHFL